MPLPSPPPLADVLDVAAQQMLPAAGAAALALSLGLLAWRRGSYLGAGLAVAAGYAVPHYSLANIPWVPTGAAWHYLPWAGLLLGLVGAMTHYLVAALARLRFVAPESWAALALTWLPRLAAVAVAATYLVPARPGEPGGRPPSAYALALATAAEWLVLDRLAARGRGANVALCLALTLLFGGGVLLYAHTASFLQLATVAGSALVGVALLAGVTGADVRGAVPVALGFWPALLVLGRRGLSADTNIADAAFWLAGLAPLVLSLWLIPAVARRERGYSPWLRVIAVMVPLVAALALAGRHESLPWEEQW